jgi:aryl-alcohol dehydrogenase-like predicted oxidoreductase
VTRLILGTAQFGGAYGATNVLGRLDEFTVSAVLARAQEAGVTLFDTAADYGDSQERLGRLAPAGSRYVTKFSLPELGVVDEAALYRTSMKVLGVDRLAGVMFHRVSDLADPRHVQAIDMLRSARAGGEVERIGVSIYDAADLELALSVFPDLDLLQFPGNVLDGRLLGDPRIAALRVGGAELHVRSAFLQGILLAPPAELSPFFRPLVPALEALGRRAADNGTTVLGLVLRYLREHSVVDGVVVGATTPVELGAILAEWNSSSAVAEPIGDAVPAELLDPRFWPR